MAKRPTDVVGFYIETSRETDFTNELIDAKGKKYTVPSMTKQEFIAECDINNIIREFLPSGQLAQMSALASAGAFADLPDSLDLQESMNIQAQASAAFDALPSRVRDRFANDPQRFLEFFHNPENRDEAMKLGLLAPPPEPPKPLEVIIKGNDAPVSPPRGAGTEGVGDNPSKK